HRFFILGKSAARKRGRTSSEIVPAVARPARRPGAEAFVVIAALTALVFAIYAQVRTHRFVLFDDPAYVSANPNVLAGLTWSGVRWAFTTIHAAYWIPATWISHMLDVQLFGPDAG